jgi:hypothetical protein
VPADTFTWRGAAGAGGTDYFTKANWSVASTRNYPGAGGVLDDVVVFDNTAVADCDAALTADLTVARLQLRANFTKVFTTSGGKNYTVTPDGGGGGQFTMEGGTLNLKDSPTRLFLDRLGSAATWSKGDLSKDGTSGAKINIYRTTFSITADATRLGAGLVVGQSLSGADGPSALQIGADRGMGNLSGHLTLFNNANIEVKQQGTLTFFQSVNSDTKGGIDVGAGGTSAITNSGKITREVVDQDGKYLYIKPKLTNDAAGAEVHLGVNTRVNFAGGLDVTQGKYTPAKDVKTKGDIKLPRGGAGMVQLDDTGLTAGDYDIWCEGNLTIEDGSFLFAAADNVYFTFHVVGAAVDLESGATLSINVDGSQEGHCDLIAADLDSTVNSSVLNVRTENASPGAGWIYTFLAAPNIHGVGWSALPNNSGYPAAYFYPTLGQLQVAGSSS